jgi:hypothetical protein
MKPAWTWLREDGALAIIGAAFVASGTWLVWTGVSNLRLGHQSLGWPTVVGKIISSGHDEDGTYIAYEYDVGGRRYTNDQVDFGMLDRGDRLGHYRVGRAVAVHYRPSDPQAAVLEPGCCGPGVHMLMAFGTVMGIIGAFTFIQTLRGRLSKRIPPEPGVPGTPGA